MDKKTYINRSFGRIKGRALGALRARALEEASPYFITQAGDVPTHSTITLEIGCGHGEHLMHRAHLSPEKLFIGCEVYQPSLAEMTKQLLAESITNVRLWAQDARLLLAELPEAVVDEVYILFPDPWPKRRHHKRRIVQHGLLDDLARVMKKGAHLHLGTDHMEYAAWMLVQYHHHPAFQLHFSQAECWKKPPAGHIQTRYQQKNKAGSAHAIFLDVVKI